VELLDLERRVELEPHFLELRTPAEVTTTGTDKGESRTALLITVTAVFATLAVALGAESAIHAIAEHPVGAAALLVLTVVLQLFSVKVYGKGSIGMSGIAVLATGFLFGPGAAMIVAVIAALEQWIRRRGLLHRAIFDASNLSLSAGSATGVYVLISQAGGSELVRLAAATAAGFVYTAVNNGLLCVAMATSESKAITTIWRERFHWARFHFLAYGPLALALTIADERLGLPGVVAFALPPILMVVSVREYVARTEEANERLEEANRQMRHAHRDTIAALSRSMEAKDFQTGGHTERVAEIAVALGARLGCEGDDLEAIEIGALLHDIGKIGVPEHILNKPGPLDVDELAVMQRHPVISEFILADTGLHPLVRQIARSSHERIDGTGYPDALPGDSIPLAARIVFVADAFDAITSDRPYRRAESVESALVELRAHAGTQFCPSVVAELERIYEEEPRLLTRATLHVLPVPTAGALVRAVTHSLAH
jgi:hypothetical protein